MVSCKSWGSGTKIQKIGREKLGLVSFPDSMCYIQACLDLAVPWDGDILYRSSVKTAKTSPKLLTDKLYQVLTSRTDKKTGPEKCTVSLQSAVGMAITNFDEFLGN